MSYLYNKEEGSNAHNIQFHAVPGHTQEASRFKVLLEELCNLERIQEVDMGHVTKGRVISQPLQMESMKAPIRQTANWKLRFMVELKRWWKKK